MGSRVQASSSNLVCFCAFICLEIVGSPSVLAAEPSDSAPAPAAAAPSGGEGQPTPPAQYPPQQQMGYPPPAGYPAPGYPPQPGYPPPGYQPPAGYPPPGYPPPGYQPQPGYPPPGYPPPAGYSPGPGSPYPPPYPGYEAVVEETPEVPVIAVHRPVRMRLGYGMGGFNPSDVNNWMKARLPSNAVVQSGVSDMVLLLSLDASAAYYPARFIGIRPNVSYLFSPKVVSDGNTSQSYWLHSLAPGLSLDLAFDQGKLARFFASPGVSYHLAWFEGYQASGVGLSLAVGAELSFGAQRSKGISLALVFRSADLGVSTRPSSALDRNPAINNLDFSSVLFCAGFQTGI
jgi:hypothetical protein